MPSAAAAAGDPVALLDARGLSKRFGGLQAVRDVDLAVREGEMLGLIGPNGAGKTTVFNLLSGFLDLDAGAVTFRDRATRGLRPHALCRLGLARTFQIVRPFPRLTVLDNVKVGAFARHPRPDDAVARARAALDEVGLGGRANAPAGSLTLPERKRLEVARALATEPVLLLLDEVMAGLNPSEIDRIVPLIAALNARGIAILLIEHNMRAVMALSHRVVVLSFGEKIAEGRPEDVVRDRRVIEAYLGQDFAPGGGAADALRPDARP